MPKILIVDDDVELCDLLLEYISQEGFSVECVHDGEAGVTKGVSGQYDAIVLDVMLPMLDGFEVLKQIRAKSHVPVLMLTARGDDTSRIVGLEIGADDYLPKPCNPRELVARIRAIFRRVHQGEQFDSSEKQALSLGGLMLDLATRKVFKGEVLVELTNSEYKVLACLLQSAGKVLSKDELTTRALGRKITPYDRSIDMHISNLRSKLWKDDETNSRIKTIRGYGYIFEDESE